MLIGKHTIIINACPEVVWAIWKDTENWHTWDNITQYYTLNGPFQKGTTGQWKPKNGPLIHLTLTSVVPLKGYVGECKLFLARFISSHFLSSANGKTQVTQQFEIKGPLAFLFAWHLGPKLKKDLVLEMESLKKQVELINNT